MFRIARGLFWSSRARMVLGLAVSAGLGWLAMGRLDWVQVGAQLGDFPVWYGIVALVAFLLATVLRAYRWQVLFLGEPAPLWRLFLVQNTGIGLNNLSPVRVVSEPAQFAMLTLHYKMPGGPAAATLGMERVLDMVSSAALLAAGLIFIPARHVFMPYVTAAFVVAGVSVVLTVLFGLATRWRFVSRIKPLSVFAHAVARLGRVPGVLAYSLFLSTVYWIAVGLCTWIVALGMGLDISPLVAVLAIVGTLYLTSSLPSLPMAAGTFEFAIVYVLRFFGVAPEAALSYALAIHAMLFVPPVLIAIAVMLTIGLRPRKVLEEAASGIPGPSNPKETGDSH